MASSFETVFQRALEINLAKYGPEVALIRGNEDLDKAHDSVIMNISSVLFKAVVVFSFPENKEIQKLYKESNGVDETNVFDVYCDIGNMVCGHVNRCLSHTYRFSGISTPIVLLEDKMTQRLLEFPATEKIAMRVTSRDGIELRLWVFVSSGTAALNFNPMAGESSSHLNDVQETESGELELF